MRVVNLTESFACDAGAENFGVKSIQLSMIFLAPVMIFITASILVLLRILIVNEVFSFAPFPRKIMIIK